MIEGDFIGLAVKTLIAVLVVTIILSTAVFYYREQYEKEWKGTEHSEKSGFTDFQGSNPKYVLWTGDVATTLDILALAQQPGTVIQPIYIPDPANSSARSEYELQITRTLRTSIATKYPQSQILPIISITRERPDDDAFNNGYDMGADDGASDAPTRENILSRWAKYYKLEITQPSTTSRNQSDKTRTPKRTKNEKQTQKSDARILSETWNCRFPVGENSVPCGLCKKCEKLNSL
jgi:hypothetical protein